MYNGNAISREEYIFAGDYATQRYAAQKQNSTDRITHAGVLAASEQITALVCPTHAGGPPLVRFRPRSGILALPHEQIVARKLQVAWGSNVCALPRSVHLVAYGVFEISIGKGGYGGPVVLICGAPLGVIGTTNMVIFGTIPIRQQL